ncbi:hypothetical protein CROQUDRAFT_108541 [Cronartium quercuum f. sp. fusiforme G11]|uniref:Uncharacterized protein n=1 Tax=Cronartium quercuum f. sp. fusiforme G11 TaxID=708437 RepID=A0A9P6TA97_9BASI|nr:hypothetical protein CROQUDRAFT_108541 [Cronartium quercuum f. sp. fusiforme G11]
MNYNTLIASLVLVGLALFIAPQVASTPSSSVSTLVSSGRKNQNKLAKRKWTFLNFNVPFGGDADATMVPPWYILYNMVYARQETIGPEKTTLFQVDGTMIHWGNYLNILQVPATANVPKSYAFLGMTSDLNHPINVYSAIPASYSWTRQNGPTGFKGNVAFDFVVSNGPDKKSDHELMLWLQWEGNQMPIGTGEATLKIHNLYGQSWTLYQGINKNTGVPVRSLLPDNQYKDHFSGDMKLWLLKLVEAGIFRDGAYLWTANMGMEAFWGESTFKAQSSLQLLWAGNNHQPGYKPPGFHPPQAGSVVPGYEVTR